MTKIIRHSNMSPAEPLWKRAPGQDKEGRALSDLMMIMPKWRGKPQALILRSLREIEVVLHHYKEAVVFADFNMRLNVLWVCVKPNPGIRLEVSAAIQEVVPDALLVSDMSAGMSSFRKQKGWSSLFRKFLPK